MRQESVLVSFIGSSGTNFRNAVITFLTDVTVGVLLDKYWAKLLLASKSHWPVRFRVMTSLDQVLGCEIKIIGEYLVNILKK